MRCFCVTLAASLSFAAVHADILAITWTGDVVKINQTTGAGVPVGPCGFNMTNSMARDGNAVYVHSGVGGGTIVKIDPITGAGAAGPVTGLLSVRGLAISPSGKMFAVNDVGFGLPDQLYVIDISTGTATLIGATNHVGIQGLTFGPGGTLYAWDVGTGTTNAGAGLIKIDPMTGASADVNPLIGSILPAADNLQAIAFSGGTLYGCRNQLYKIDPSNGDIALIGSGGYSDIRGIEGIGPSCVGDINGDGKTCQGDLGILLATYGLCEGDPGYVAAANLSTSTTCPTNPGLQVIDQTDLGVLLADFGCGGCP